MVDGTLSGHVVANWLISWRYLAPREPLVGEVGAKRRGVFLLCRCTSLDPLPNPPPQGRAIAYGNSRVRSETWEEFEPAVSAPVQLLPKRHGRLRADLQDSTENKTESDRNRVSQRRAGCSSEMPIAQGLFFICDSPTPQGGREPTTRVAAIAHTTTINKQLSHHQRSPRDNPLRRHRHQSPAHPRHGREPAACGRDARELPCPRGRPRGHVRQAIPAGRARRRPAPHPGGYEHRAGAELGRQQRARAARHRGDAPRQGLHVRQAWHHLARAACRGAQGAGRDQAHLLDLLFGALSGRARRCAPASWCGRA